MPDPSVADMTSALQGVNFPASKNDLKMQARNNNAPDEIISAIEHLPDEQFGTMADVARLYGEEGAGQVSGSPTEESRKGESR